MEIPGPERLRIADEAAQEIPGLFAHLWIRRQLEPTAPVHHPGGGDLGHLTYSPRIDLSEAPSGGVVPLVTEGRPPKEHLPPQRPFEKLCQGLEHDDAHGPHVALLAIGLLAVDLKSKWRALARLLASGPM